MELCNVQYLQVLPLPQSWSPLHNVTVVLSVPGQLGIKGVRGPSPLGLPGFTGHKGDKGAAGLPGMCMYLYMCGLKDVFVCVDVQMWIPV